MDAGLKDQCVLVTGASGGIGAATVRVLAACGARIAVHYQSNADSAEALCRELAVETVAVQADLTNEVHTRRMFDTIAKAFQRLDGVVINAGIWNATPVPTHQLSMRQWRDTLDTDLTSAFLTARAFMRHLAEVPRESASMVLVGSTAGLFGEAGHLDYAAAKAALIHGLTSTLKNEIVTLAPRGRVNCVCPGWTETPMTAGLTNDAQIVRQATATMSLQKIASAQDIAHAIAFLCSETLAGHISGAILPVAGGMEGRLLRP